MKITIEIEEGDYEGVIKFMEHILMCGEEETEEAEETENVRECDRVLKYCSGSGFVFMNPVFKSFEDAVKARDAMDECMKAHGYVTVSDLKRMAEYYVSSPDDLDYGWWRPFVYSIRKFSISAHEGGGWIIDLPGPKNVLHARK